MTTKPRSFTGTEARLLLRRARTGTLASLNRDGGTPYGSLVNVATDVDGRPLILISNLAWHTRNLLADGRASILVAEPPASGDALTGPRVTVMGAFRRTEDPRVRRRYLARHPEADGYAGFDDFAFWRLEPELAHAVAGFGRIETLEAAEVFVPAKEMEEIEESAIRHMNEDHFEQVQHLAGGQEGKWRMAAIDPDGANLSDGERSLRVGFPAPVFTAGELRTCLAELSAKIKK
jgi:heme oxygenase (biliverdin-IX-beta and delta-forming)